MSSFKATTHSTDTKDSSVDNKHKLYADPNNQAPLSNVLWRTLATSTFYPTGSIKTTDSKNSNAPNRANIQANAVTNKIQRASKEQQSNLHADVPTLGSGEALPENMRNYFEPRFGVDFSNVRIHRDTNTADYANNINARAFAYGNNIGFSKGAFSNDTSGKKLLAHELTHVVQQGQAGPQNNVLQREVAFTNCQSGVHEAPPIPEVFLAMDEMLATSDIALATIYITFAIESLQAGQRPANTQQAFRAYLLRFGLPEQLASGRFRERFGGQSFATENEAIISELETIKARLEQIRNFFSKNLRYICTSDSANTTIGNCTMACDGAFAWVCAGGGANNTLVICPSYWSLSALQNSFGLIHEASHLVFGFGDPAGSSMTTRLRGRNPVCYSGFIASIHGHNPPDPDCPALTLPVAPAPAPAPSVQPKLKVGAVDSPEEKQADAVAESIVNNQYANIQSTQQQSVVQRLCNESEDEAERHP